MLGAKLNRPSALRDVGVFHFASPAQSRSSKRLMYHWEIPAKNRAPRPTKTSARLTVYSIIERYIYIYPSMPQRDRWAGQDAVSTRLRTSEMNGRPWSIFDNCGLNWSSILLHRIYCLRAAWRSRINGAIVSHRTTRCLLADGRLAYILPAWYKADTEHEINRD